jgi:hypothetical protein
MVSAYGRQFERLEKFERLLRPQRAGDAVAQIDGEVDSTRPDVGEHGLQSGKISMDIGDDCHSHRRFPFNGREPCPLARCFFGRWSGVAGA